MDNEIIQVSGGEMLEAINRSEIDGQIATAHKFPRDIVQCKQNMVALATMDDDVAYNCFYHLERKGKDGQVSIIEGPSVRFTEIISACWKPSQRSVLVFSYSEVHLKLAEPVFRQVVCIYLHLSCLAFEDALACFVVDCTDSPEGAVGAYSKIRCIGVRDGVVVRARLDDVAVALSFKELRHGILQQVSCNHRKVLNLWWVDALLASPQLVWRFPWI